MKEQERIDRTEGPVRDLASDAKLNEITAETTAHIPITFVLPLEPTGPDILLFDEADSLFGKRSTVEDNHKRYSDKR